MVNRERFTNLSFRPRQIDKQNLEMSQKDSFSTTLRIYEELAELD